MEKDEKSKKLSIIVYSCWKNRDMWKVFSKLFSIYWADCSYTVVLLTDSCDDNESLGDCVFDEVVTIDATWGTMLKTALDKIETPYVMLFMDDYLLCDQVKNGDIERYVSMTEKYDAINLRLIESPKCAGVYSEEDRLGYYEKGEAYSLSTQVGIWSTRMLYDIIDNKYSAWDFERIASVNKDSGIDAPILVALDYVFPYEEGVRKGRWMEAGAKLCRRNGIPIDSGTRPVMNNYDMAKIYLKGAIIDINPTLVVKVQNLVNKVKK